MNPMWDWLAQNSSLVQASVGGITALVWIVYLQILVIGFRRQRRTKILIHLGGSQGLDARTFISNLGFEPIYILEIILTIWSSDGERETFIADRTEIAKEDLSSPSATTFQGPLKSGKLVDIGSIEDLLQRARQNTAEEIQLEEISRVELKVAAISAASTAIVAAKRQFYLEFENDECRIHPKTLYATQIRSWWGRQHTKRQLQAHLKH